MFALGFNAGVIFGFIGGALVVIAFLLGIITEDRFDVTSLVNRHRSDKK